MHFRALLEPGTPKSLVLKWDFSADAMTAVGGGDDLFVGLHNPGTNTTTVLYFTRATDGMVTAGTVGTELGLTTYQRVGGGAWTQPTNPMGIAANARIDIACTAMTFPTQCSRWTVRARIPMTVAAGGIDLPDNFPMWFEARNTFGGSAEIAKWPNSAALVNRTAFPVPGFPATGSWNTVDVSGAVTCSQGIELLNSHISVSSPSYGEGTRIHLTEQNTFHARPVNRTGTTFNPDSIKARFRIANWGSAGGANPQWDLVPGCSAAIGSGAPGTIGMNVAFDLTCNWTLSSTEACEYRPDQFPGCTAPEPKDDHQCVLVELSTNTAPNATFSPDSSWQNMNFGPASELVRTATIQVRGLSPVPDVYLFVERQNMPDRVDPKQDLDEERWSRHYKTLPRQLLSALKGVRVGRVGTKLGKVLEQAYFSGLVPQEAFEALLPTYKVHVWHDTGKTTSVNGVTKKLLEAQPSYGLFVTHDGDLHGWRDSLTTQGGQLHEIAPNFYRLDMNGKESVKVTTKIEALEKPPADCPTCPICEKCEKCEKCAHGHTHDVDGHRHPPGTKVPPHHHCSCSTPGFNGRGLMPWGLALGLLTAVALRRRQRKIVP